MDTFLATKASELLDLYVESLAAQIVAVKSDKSGPALQAEFFKRVSSLSQD